MDKLLKFLAVIMCVLQFSCEQESNNTNKPFIAGDIEIENHQTINPNIVIVIYCEDYCIWPFDMTLNGEDDFGISLWRCWEYCGELKFHNFSDYQLVCNEDDYLKKLNYGDTIHDGLNWRSGEEFLMSYSDPSSSLGDGWFRLDADAFIGFRKTINNGYIMGWLRISETTHQEGNATKMAFLIKDFGLDKILEE